jgi:hypothetical protein
MLYKQNQKNQKCLRLSQAQQHPQNRQRRKIQEDHPQNRQRQNWWQKQQNQKMILILMLVRPIHLILILMLVRQGETLNQQPKDRKRT